MFLHSLSLQNFRSYKQKDFSFNPQATLIVGPNASGKTNILEAIYLISRGKSFRADLDREMISYGEELGRVIGVACDRFSKSLLRDTETIDSGSSAAILISPSESNSRKDISAFEKSKGARIVKVHKIGQTHQNSELEVILTTGEVQGKRTAGKIFKVNGVGRLWRDFVGGLKVVLFRPEDSEIVLGSPSIRRNYLDTVLEQVDADYRRCNLAYSKGLRQRNKLLDFIRDGKAQKTQLEYWNRLLIKNGEVISNKREEMIEIFNFSAKGGSASGWQFSNFNKDLTIEYDKSAISPERLAKYAEAEVALGATLVGPHRDDIKLKVKSQKSKIERELSLFGSRGEQRMAILALKMAELAFIEQKSAEKPVLLLDDIFSELDEAHREEVLNLIDRQQTIITTTETDLVPKEFLGKMERIEI